MGASNHFMAIDLGTTHIKAAVFEAGLGPVAVSQVKNPADSVCEIGPCYQAHGVWRRVIQAVKACGCGEVASISLTGMADSGLLVDAQGQALTEVISWHSPAGGESRTDILKAYSLEGLYQMTGQTLHPKLALSRLMWYRQNRPQVFDRAAYWLSLQDYVLFRLTGQFTTDVSLACRTMLFDVQRRRWLPELAHFCGIGERLPPVVEMGAQTGVITEGAALLLGLLPGSPVFACGHDHPCALFALYALGQGEVVDSMGTSEVFTGLLPSPLPPGAAQLGINQGCFADGGLYWMANLPSSGASLEWLRGIASTGGEVGYGFFTEDALTDAGGVMYFPFLNGGGVPHPDPNRRGAFMGVTTATTVRHLARAINQGIAFETRRIFDALQGLTGKPLAHVTVAGGGALNTPLLKAKADITGIRLDVPGVTELTTLGAVLFAQRALGIKAWPKLAVSSVTPAQHCPKVWDAPYHDYQTLCGILYGKNAQGSVIQ